MSESGKERFILTKSYEIAYALFRIAGTLHEGDFAERLRAAGAGVLEAAAVQDYAVARKPLQAIEALIKFAGDVNLITLANADLLLREVYVLDAAVVERMHAAKEAPLNLSDVFSAEYPATEAVAQNVQEDGAAAGSGYPANFSYPANSSREDNPANHSGNGIAGYPSVSDHVASVVSSVEPSPSYEAPTFLKADIRQSAILDKIRQSGNCRIRDLQEILPGCSERTLRYDLQSLLERNLIERVGAGGPSVSYRMRQNAG